MDFNSLVLREVAIAVGVSRLFDTHVATTLSEPERWTAILKITNNPKDCSVRSKLLHSGLSYSLDVEYKHDSMGLLEEAESLMLPEQDPVAINSERYLPRLLCIGALLCFFKQQLISNRQTHTLVLTSTRGELSVKSDMGPGHYSTSQVFSPDTCWQTAWELLDVIDGLICRHAKIEPYSQRTRRELEGFSSKLRIHVKRTRSTSTNQRYCSAAQSRPSDVEPFHHDLANSLQLDDAFATRLCQPLKLDGKNARGIIYDIDLNQTMVKLGRTSQRMVNGSRQTLAQFEQAAERMQTRSWKTKCGFPQVEFSSDFSDLSLAVVPMEAVRLIWWRNERLRLDCQCGTKHHEIIDASFQDSLRVSHMCRDLFETRPYGDLDTARAGVDIHLSDTMLARLAVFCQSSIAHDYPKVESAEAGAWRRLSRLGIPGYCFNSSKSLVQRAHYRQQPTVQPKPVVYKRDHVASTNLERSSSKKHVTIERWTVDKIDKFWVDELEGEVKCRVYWEGYAEHTSEPFTNLVEDCLETLERGMKCRLKKTHISNREAKLIRMLLRLTS